MELLNFRELLIKKTDDKNIQFLAKYIRNDMFEDMVLESLEKMATKGTAANAAVTDFAGSATSTSAGMLRDALGHHVSSYHAANKAGDDSSANQHLSRAVNLMDFAARGAKHSQGKMHMDYVPMKAWEMNYTGDERKPNGKYKQDQKGVRRKLTGPNTMFPDYKYLEQDPHEGYTSKGKLASTSQEGKVHQGAYPFEDIKINGKHIHIDPNQEHSGEYKGHELDTHPAFSDKKKGQLKQLWEHPQHHVADDMEGYADKVKTWEDTAPKQWKERHKALRDGDKEAYAGRRGDKPSQGIGSKLGDYVSKKATKQDAQSQSPQAHALREQEASGKGTPSLDIGYEKQKDAPKKSQAQVMANLSSDEQKELETVQSQFKDNTPQVQAMVTKNWLKNRAEKKGKSE